MVKHLTVILDFAKQIPLIYPLQKIKAKIQISKYFRFTMMSIYSSLWLQFTQVLEANAAIKKLKKRPQNQIAQAILELGGSTLAYLSSNNLQLFFKFLWQN